MNIYSIKEILKATNNFLDTDVKSKVKKNIQISNEKIPTNTQTIIIEAEKTLSLEKKNNKNTEMPLILENQIPTTNTINQFNYKIKIKNEVKDHMINELHVYLKKKIKKNTLKLIIDEKLKIKNLKNKILFLIQKEKKLSTNYQALKNNYELVIQNNEILKVDKNNLQNNLNKVIKNKKYFELENKKLKFNLNEIENKNKTTNIVNNNLRRVFAQINSIKDLLIIENKKFKDNLSVLQDNLEKSLLKNRSFEINNSELKNTISRYIVKYKEIQEKIKLIENSKNLKPEEDVQQVKFYQDENIRLSSELLLTRKKNETIKINLDNNELEKQKISNKIKELNNTITGKSNIISSPITKEISPEIQKDINNLNDTEQKSLDEVINRIFAKT